MSDDPWAIWHKGGRMSDCVEGTIVPKTFLPAIGFVIVAFSRLNSQVDLTIAYILGADRETGRAFAAVMPNYRPRIELLDHLVGLENSRRRRQGQAEATCKACRQSSR